MSEYGRYGHILYEFKSKQYLKWAKNEYPHLDLHHLLRKNLDYLLYPVKHQTHLQQVHSHKAFYFEKWLQASVDIFLVYVNKKFFEKFDQQLTLSDYEPATLKALFEQVQKWEDTTRGLNGL